MDTETEVTRSVNNKAKFVKSTGMLIRFIKQRTNNLPIQNNP